MTVRSAQHLVHGLDGPEVSMSGRVAAYLERYARLAEFHRDHRGHDEEIDQFLIAMHVVAERWRRGSGVGTIQAARSEPDASSSQWISTATAANRLHIGNRAIVKAIDEGRVKAEMREGRWWIHADELAHYMERRNAG